MHEPPLYFSKGNYSTGHPAYIERVSDRKAFNLLHARVSIYVFAPRQMGKTLLFKYIADVLKREGWTSCFINLGEKGNLTAPDWFQSLAEEIGLACGLEKSKINVKNQSEFKLFIQHQVGLSNNPERWLALFFDEVEGLLKNQDFSDEFLMTLRSLYLSQSDFPGRFFLGIAGCTDKYKLVRNQDISPMNVMEEILLEYFTPEQTARLVNRLAAGKIRFQPELTAQILEWTAGQPYLTHRFCECLSLKASERDPAEITKEMVDEVVCETFSVKKIRDTNLEHIYHHMRELKGVNRQMIQDLLDGTFSAGDPRADELLLLGAARMTDDDKMVVANTLYRRVLEKLKSQL
jgi:hypothetical protein